MNTNVQAIEHSDVRGKKLWYLHIYNTNGEILINIGQKSYNTITNLLKEPPIEEQIPTSVHLNTTEKDKSNEQKESQKPTTTKK